MAASLLIKASPPLEIPTLITITSNPIYKLILLNGTIVYGADNTTAYALAIVINKFLTI